MLEAVALLAAGLTFSLSKACSSRKEATAAALKIFWRHLETYEALLRELTPEALLLLKWRHPQLLSLARTEGTGPYCSSDAAASSQLKHLLKARERAYIVAVAALNRWEDVERAVLEVVQTEGEGPLLLRNGFDTFVELWLMDVKHPSWTATEWAAALSIVPQGEFFRELHASLPSWVTAQASSAPDSVDSNCSKGKTA